MESQPHPSQLVAVDSNETGSTQAWVVLGQKASPCYGLTPFTRLTCVNKQTK
jgi:hypothetical protein